MKKALLLIASAAVFALCFAGRPWIEQVKTAGLLSTKDSLAYRVAEIERHIHNAEMWYGKATGDTYLDPTSLAEWQVEAKDNGYTGIAIQISNGDELSCAYFDLHEILITATTAANKVQKIQILYGTGGVGGAAVATEIAFFVPAAGKSTAIEMMMHRIPCNSKMWVLAHSETNNATIDFIVGIHTYDG